jgi:hypothetical protein
VALPKPEPGLVISYAYLWRAEHEEGREEGVKIRPCVIVMMVQDIDGKSLLSVAPVTHSAPERPEEAVEIPALTKQRLGMDSARSWVVITEVNDFVWPGPDLRPIPQDLTRFDYGFLPPKLFREIRDRMKAFGATGQFQSIPRTE